MREGRTPPRESVTSAINSLSELTSASTKRNPFLALEAELETSRAGNPRLPALRAELRRVVREQAIPAHEQFLGFLEDRYLPGAGQLD